MVKMQLPLDMLVLRAFFDYGAGGLYAHPPIGGIIKYLPREFQNNEKTIKKSVRRLVAEGFLIKHPTRGDTTYDLSPKGRDHILNS